MSTKNNKIEHIKGRYAIIVAIIALLGIVLKWYLEREPPLASNPKVVVVPSKPDYTVTNPNPQDTNLQQPEEEPKVNQGTNPVDEPETTELPPPTNPVTSIEKEPILENEVEEKNEDTRDKYIEFTIIHNSNLSNAEFFIDDKPANIIENNLTIKRIKVIDKEEGRTIKALVGEKECILRTTLSHNQELRLKCKNLY